MMVMLDGKRRCRVEVLLCCERSNIPNNESAEPQKALVNLWKPSSVELDNLSFETDDISRSPIRILVLPPR
jgi:hypothetical protein